MRFAYQGHPFEYVSLCGSFAGKPSKRSRKEAEDDVEDAASADEDDDAEVSEDEEEEEEEEEKPVKKPAKKKAGKAAKKEEKPKKKKKDPNEPKRGMSAFMFFANAKRASVKEDNPGISFGETGKKLGEMWKALDGDGKKSFEEQAAKDKARYEKEIAAYRAKQEAAGGDDDDDE